MKKVFSLYGFWLLLFSLNTYGFKLRRSNFYFIFISNKISLKSAEGCNPSTHEVYKSASNQRKQKNINVKTQQT